MIDLNRRGMIGAALAYALGPSGSSPGGTVSLADFGAGNTKSSEEAFRAALAEGTTVVVPDGTYTFSSGNPVEIPSGRTLVGSGRSVIRKLGSQLYPLFRARNARNIVLQGLELRGAQRLEQEVFLRPGQREWALTLDLGHPPAIALVLLAGAKRLPLQPEADFTVRDGAIKVLPKVDMRGVTSALMWREQALCPLVDFSETTDSAMLDLACSDGALWIQGTGNKPLRTLVQGCFLTNGQVRVWGQDNEINPLHIGRRRSEEPNGPRSVRIERNRFRGRIGSGAAKHYLRFGERGAGIEIQSFASDITISENDIRGQAGDGIWLASCADSIVLNNHVEGNALSGIGLESGGIRESQRCTLRGNTVLNNWFDGCDLNFGSGPAEGDISIAENVFSGNGFDMAPLSGGCGIFINGVIGANVENNTCDNNNISGILCVRSESININGNNVSSNGRSSRKSFGVGVGIGVNDSANVAVLGNVCGRSRGVVQKVGIAFITDQDRQRTRASGNMKFDRLPASVGVWNGRSYDNYKGA